MSPTSPTGNLAGVDRPVRIVVLGAGYAGLSAFLELQHLLTADQAHLTLVNQNPFHTFTTELHTLAAGEEDEETVTVPLERVVHPPSELILQRVTKIYPDQDRVELDRGEVPYDYLLVALGSEPEYFGVPGAAERGFVLNNLAEADRLRQHLAALAADTTKRRPAVIIAGGGLTGVEVAGEVADHYRDRFSLTLVEGGPSIMSGFRTDLINAARHVLESKGITLLVATRIAQVQEGRVILSTGRELPCDLLIWAGGVRANRVVEESGFAVTRRGRGKVDASLRAEGYPRVYLIGDVAAAVDPETGQEVLPTAQVAVQEGGFAARALYARLRGEPEPAFRPRMHGMFATLGRRDAVGQFGMGATLGVYGPPAFAVKRLIESYHAYQSGGMLKVLRRVLHWGNPRTASVPLSEERS